MNTLKMLFVFQNKALANLVAVLESSIMPLLFLGSHHCFESQIPSRQVANRTPAKNKERRTRRWQVEVNQKAVLKLYQSRFTKCPAAIGFQQLQTQHLVTYFQA